MYLCINLYKSINLEDFKAEWLPCVKQERFLKNGTQREDFHWLMAKRMFSSCRWWHEPRVLSSVVCMSVHLMLEPRHGVCAEPYFSRLIREVRLQSRCQLGLESQPRWHPLSSSHSGLLAGLKSSLPVGQRSTGKLTAWQQASLRASENA